MDTTRRSVRTAATKVFLKAAAAPRVGAITEAERKVAPAPLGPREELAGRAYRAPTASVKAAYPPPIADPCAHPRALSSCCCGADGAARGRTDNGVGRATPSARPRPLVAGLGVRHAARGCPKDCPACGYPYSATQASAYTSLEGPAGA